MSEYPCRCCCKLIFTLGASSLFIWLTLHTTIPTCSIEKFTLPALNSTNHTAATAAGNRNITFMLKLNNPNKDKGINYDDVNLDFFLVPNASDPKRNATFVGNYTIPHFYQGHKKSAKKEANCSTTGVDWADLVEKNQTPTAFRVDVATTVRFKIMFWRTKRHRLAVGGVVLVDGTGTRVKAEKGVKLKSGAAEQVGRGCSVRIVVLVSFLIAGFLNFGEF